MSQADNETITMPNEIALCLSGGGYRAAGYHLGTIDYLDHLGLREKVTMLSTVSGGTFIGTAYAMALVEKEPFNAFFSQCYGFFKDSRYIENLFKFLGTERPDRPGKQRNLIEAAAEVYATSFLKDEKTGRPYLFGKIINAKIPLQAVIFNTTGFYSGNGFVFQKLAMDGSIGNIYAHISPDAIKNIRLGDIAAASSCFPGGFEPLAFPDDFVWPGEIPKLERYWTMETNQPKVPKSIPLMDGGVADNVGLNNIMNAIKEIGYQGKLDLIIASDVDPKPIDLYRNFPLEPKPDPPSFLKKESRIKLKLNSMNYLMILISTLIILTMVGQGIYTLMDFNAKGFKISNLFFYLIALLLSAVVVGELFWFRRLFKNHLVNWFDRKMHPGSKISSWDAFKRLSLGQALNMIKLRISSLYAMTNSVFMRSIRQLTYDMTLTNPDYKDKFISDLIYYVKERIYSLPSFGAEGISKPSPKMLKIIDAIVNMDSTLWWQHDYQLPCLFACGQISLCLSLFNHYQGKKEHDPDVRKLFHQLHDDWENLNRNPYYFLELRYPDLKKLYPNNRFPLPPDANEK